MLDGLSLDQLRAFISAADHGSFSAAGRKLLRAQSAISDLVRRLEHQMGVDLFDRSGRSPRLTGQGALLLSDARAIVAEVDAMRTRAKGMAAGLEAELSIVVDVMFPLQLITEAAVAFTERFRTLPLRLFAEVLGNSFAPLLDGRCSIGIVGPTSVDVRGLTLEFLGNVPVVMVASVDHPLAKLPGPIAAGEMAKHRQLVLTDRSTLTGGRDYFVLSENTWRLGDLFVKRAFLLGGLGWGGMPLHSVEEDLNNGKLALLDVESFPSSGRARPMSVAYRANSPPGPAGRWLIEWIKQAMNDRTVQG